MYKNINIKLLLLWIFGLQLISSFMGLITRNNLTNWYNFLNKSALTPLPIIFPIIWTILYVLIAISGYLIWQKNNKKLKISFILQMILNWLWTPIFFHFHWIFSGLVVIFFIIVNIAYFIYKTFNKYLIISLLMLPYFIWSCYALYLNYYIYINN